MEKTFSDTAAEDGDHEAAERRRHRARKYVDAALEVFSLEATPYHHAVAMQLRDELTRPDDDET